MSYLSRVKEEVSLPVSLSLPSSVCLSASHCCCLYFSLLQLIYCLSSVPEFLCFFFFSLSGSSSAFLSSSPPLFPPSPCLHLYLPLSLQFDSLLFTSYVYLCPSLHFSPVFKSKFLSAILIIFLSLSFCCTLITLSLCLPVCWHLFLFWSLPLPVSLGLFLPPARSLSSPRGHLRTCLQLERTPQLHLQPPHHTHSRERFICLIMHLSDTVGG